MKKMMLMTAAALVGTGVFAQNKWVVNKAHAKVGFTITHLSISDVDGNFKKFDAAMTASKPDFSDASFELTADAASVNTDNERRDEDLRSDHFFDVAKYPVITFKSTGISKTGEKTFKLKGDLTMHGVTRPVVLDMAVTGTAKNMQSQKPIAGFKVTGTINRTDFGVGHMPAAMVGDDVEIRAVGEFDEE